MTKTCKNCNHSFILNKQYYCGINGLETQEKSTCNQFKYAHARNMYSLCSSSECFDCEYFKKEISYCNISNKSKI